MTEPNSGDIPIEAYLDPWEVWKEYGQLFDTAVQVAPDKDVTYGPTGDVVLLRDPLEILDQAESAPAGQPSPQQGAEFREWVRERILAGELTPQQSIELVPEWGYLSEALAELDARIAAQGATAEVEVDAGIPTDDAAAEDAAADVDEDGWV